jgi:hypothetical protein
MYSLKLNFALVVHIFCYYFVYINGGGGGLETPI